MQKTNKPRTLVIFFFVTFPLEDDVAKLTALDPSSELLEDFEERLELLVAFELFDDLEPPLFPFELLSIDFELFDDLEPPPFPFELLPIDLELFDNLEPPPFPFELFDNMGSFDDDDELFSPRCIPFDDPPLPVDFELFDELVPLFPFPTFDDLEPLADFFLPFPSFELRVFELALLLL